MPRGRRRGAALLLGLILPFAFCMAQEDEPPPKKSGVRISFLPPPMEGTLSLGIYDKTGKLVRALAREAREKNFTVGLNGFITNWDGKDDAGKAAAPGSYRVRGYSVGAVEVEGVAMHGNDWITDDDSPRVTRVLSIAVENRHLALWGECSDGKPRSVVMEKAGDFDGAIAPEQQPGAATASVREGKIFIVENDGAPRALDLPEIGKPIAACLGRGDGIWVIDEKDGQTEVKEFDSKGAFHRRLAIAPGEPVPQRIFASRTTDLIFLIEEAAGIQRVRGLQLETGAPPADGEPAATSTWKTVLVKTIVASPAFSAVADKLGRAKPFIPEEKFTVKLIPNPLIKDESTTAFVTIGFDQKGSFLQTLDGLPLKRITETPLLKWAVIGREGSGKQLTIFQSDGAVVEEFKARKLANMMAFDAGEYDLAKEK